MGDDVEAMRKNISAKEKAAALVLDSLGVSGGCFGLGFGISSRMGALVLNFCIVGGSLLWF